MSRRSGADPTIKRPRLLTACARRLRGNPRGSHVMNGSFDEGGAPWEPAPGRVAFPYASRSLNMASPAGVIGGTGSGLLFWGPTHTPERSLVGAGPGGFGILGTPSRMNPSGPGR